MLLNPTTRFGDLDLAFAPSGTGGYAELSTRSVDYDLTGAPFDDFLGLAARDFSLHRVVAFVGESGSGKSTAIRFLLACHPDFRYREVLIIDEARIADLVGLWRPIARGAKALVASHLGAATLRAFLPFPRVAVYRTDRDRGKSQRYLGRIGVAASAEAVQAYVFRFGATYTDVDLILERFCALDRNG